MLFEVEFVGYLIETLALLAIMLFKFNSFSMILQTEASPRQYRGIFHALSTVFREEGARALYKGWLPSVIGVVSETINY